MDLEQEELESLALTAIVRESVQIPRSSPRTFALLTLAFIFPLSFAVLAHPLLTHPLLLRLLDPASASSSSSSSFSTSSALSLLLFYQFAYLLFLFVFSLLSTAALVFTVASLYAAKPVSFSSSLAAVPPILPRLFSTFLWVFLLLLLYNLAFAGSLLALLSLFDRPEDSPTFLLSLLSLLLFFLLAHVYVSALWHLASVVSVLEPIQGHAAMSKAYHLLRGKTATAGVLIAAYLGACGTIGSLFRMIVVAGGDVVEDEHGRVEGPMVGLVPRIAFGAALVAVLVVVNLVGLLVQSVFYHVCKSYHHQGIDKRSLYDHLGGYLGEYAPLKSSIQMETF